VNAKITAFRAEGGKWDLICGMEFRDWGLSVTVDAADSPETSVHIYESTCHHIPEECSVSVYLNFTSRE
jgi:hypothetical protein